MSASKRLWKPFIIPKHVSCRSNQHLGSRPNAHNTQILEAPSLTSTPLLHLPIEILCLIFKYADLITQFTLALSCRNLLQISTLVPFKCSPFINRPVSDQNVVMEELLRRLKPLTATGRPNKTWMLCVDCLQYRPAKKSYWLQKEESWGECGISSWVHRWSLQCPECEFSERQRRLEECRIARERYERHVYGNGRL